MTKRRNYSREIHAQVANGRIAVSSVGPQYPVTYSPRSKTDPQPWVSNAYRYSGREVHTVAKCGNQLLMWSGRMTRCGLPAGHPKAHQEA